MADVSLARRGGIAFQALLAMSADRQVGGIETLRQLPAWQEPGAQAWLRPHLEREVVAAEFENTECTSYFSLSDATDYSTRS